VEVRRYPTSHVSLLRLINPNIDIVDFLIIFLSLRPREANERNAGITISPPGYVSYRKGKVVKGPKERFSCRLRDSLD
jgi:hypothetical protein